MLCGSWILLELTRVVGETPGLQMPGEGQHRLRELEVGLRERVRTKPGEIRRAIIAEVEAIGIGALQAGDHGLRARILDRPCRAKAERDFDSDRRCRPPLRSFLLAKILSGVAARRSRIFSATTRSAGSSEARRVGRRSLLGCARRGWPASPPACSPGAVEAAGCVRRSLPSRRRSGRDRGRLARFLRKNGERGS